MKTETYFKTFKNKAGARNWARMKNRACAAAGNRRDIFAVVDGPEDGFAVVDLNTAIELGGGYTWES